MAMFADFDWAEMGQRIYARRLALKKTQQQLATEAGLTQNAIFRLEIGNTNPQISTIWAVAKALGMSSRELVRGVTDDDPRFGERMAAVRRILESGDDAAIRAMDHGLEGAQTLLDRTGGLRHREMHGGSGGKSGSLLWMNLDPNKDPKSLLSELALEAVSTNAPVLGSAKNRKPRRKGFKQ
jgi:transcriptional regulator with XRE-family HTH domain